MGVVDRKTPFPGTEIESSGLTPCMLGAEDTSDTITNDPLDARGW